MCVSERQAYAHLPHCTRNKVNSCCALGGQGLMYSCFRRFLKCGCGDETAGSWENAQVLRGAAGGHRQRLCKAFPCGPADGKPCGSRTGLHMGGLQGSDGTGCQHRQMSPFCFMAHPEASGGIVPSLPQSVLVTSCANIWPALARRKQWSVVGSA